MSKRENEPNEDIEAPELVDRYSGRPWKDVRVLCREHRCLTCGKKISGYAVFIGELLFLGIGAYLITQAM